MKQNAFTLAEVLITLVIIGVIAAMTIPTLMGSTNDKQYKSKFKKAISSVSQAIALDMALYGNKIEEPSMGESCEEHNAKMIKNHLSVIDSCYGGNCNNFKTADGIIYSIGCGGFNVNLVGDGVSCLYGEWDSWTAGFPQCGGADFDGANHSAKVVPGSEYERNEMLYD